MKTYKVAILGVTGAVGQGMVKTLMECSFPIRELHFLASAKSTERKLTIADKEYVVEETTESNFDGMDIVLGAAENNIAEKYLPITAEKGMVVVGSSSAFRLDKQVPLIIPEVNLQTVREHHGIIADPNCATIIALVALQPLHVYANAKRMVVPTYRVVGGAGVNGIYELNQQVGALAHDREIAVNTFRYQVVYNLIPQIGGFNKAGCSSEEVKIQNEGRKIMSNPELCISCTCVRVPVIHSHSESVMVEFEKEISVGKTRELLQGAPNVKLVDGPQKQIYPIPLDITDQDLVFAGYICEDMSGHANVLSLWCCGDQIHKEAATNTVQIARLIIQEKGKQQE